MNGENEGTRKIYTVGEVEGLRGGDGTRGVGKKASRRGGLEGDMQDG